MPLSIRCIIVAKIFSEPPAAIGPGPCVVCRWLRLPVLPTERAAPCAKAQEERLRPPAGDDLDGFVREQVRVPDALDRGEVLPQIAAAALGGAAAPRIGGSVREVVDRSAQYAEELAESMAVWTELRLSIPGATCPRERCRNRWPAAATQSWDAPEASRGRVASSPSAAP